MFVTCPSCIESEASCAARHLVSPMYASERPCETLGVEWWESRTHRLPPCRSCSAVGWVSLNILLKVPDLANINLDLKIIKLVPSLNRLTYRPGPAAVPALASCCGILCVPPAARHSTPVQPAAACWTVKLHYVQPTLPFCWGFSMLCTTMH